MDDAEAINMGAVGNGVKAVIRKDERFLVLVKPDGTFDLPGGRVEFGETNECALHREIDEETGLKVKIRGPVGKWSFFKNPNLLIKGITFACTYLAGKVKLCAEHKQYFWVGIDKINKYAYAESSSEAHITTKGTKRQKQNYLFSLRDLRVLRGENHIRHIKLEFPR